MSRPGATQAFVAVDFETTGLNPQQDHIMQVGAVRMPFPAPWRRALGGPRATAATAGPSATDPAQDVRRFVRLIKPPAPVSASVQGLTGIGERHLQDAPPLSQVAPDFFAFVGGAPLVVHHAGFDGPLLERMAAACPQQAPAGPLFDTLELARIALPQAPSHSLTALAAQLELAHPQPHDAGADAQVTAAVFCRLLALLAAYPAAVRRDLSRLARATPQLGDAWPLARLLQHLEEITQEAPGSGSPPALQSAPAPEAGHRQRNRFQFQPASEAAPAGSERKSVPQPAPDGQSHAGPAAALVHQFARGGSLAAALGSDFEAREGQLAMLTEVAAALERRGHLLVEAGPGTGKSLAYLVPGIHHASQSGQPLIVSTHTIHLQEQLWQQDLPLAAQVLGLPFRAALLKGRSHYLCGRRWLEMLADPGGVPAGMRPLMARLITWTAGTQTGDRRELRLRRQEQRRFWQQQLGGDPEQCPRRLCQECSHCFAHEAQAGAQEADVVIVNHALLLADLQAERGILPAYRQVICDEAHHLEDAATQHFTVALSREGLQDRLAACDPLRAGTAAAILALVAGVDLASHRQQSRDQLALADEPGAVAGPGLRPWLGLMQAVDACRQVPAAFFQACATLAAAAAAGQGELRLTDALRQQPAWTAVVEEGYRVMTLVQQLVDAVRLLTAALRGGGAELPEDALVTLEQAAGALELWLERLETMLEGAGDGQVAWLQLRPRRTPVLQLAPLEIGQRLAEGFFAAVDTAVLTSATLTIDGSFDYVCRRLGLAGEHEPVCRSLASPFDYRRQAFLGVATDAPDPRRSSPQVYHDGLAQAISQLVCASRGGTLVLFTAHRTLRSVHRRLAPALEEQGFRLLAQGVHGDRSSLLRRFRAEEGAVLMGTASFWEGIDLPGPDLRCVIVTRLPFLPPGRPLVAARCERLESEGISAFRHYLLPDAVLQLKQGFGRLIRRRNDRGAVIVLDPRIHPQHSSYGRLFVRSLPDVSRVASSLEPLARHLTAFLAGDADGTEGRPG